jgi:hypothetical protein
MEQEQNHQGRFQQGKGPPAVQAGAPSLENLLIEQGKPHTSQMDRKKQHQKQSGGGQQHASIPSVKTRSTSDSRSHGMLKGVAGFLCAGSVPPPC